MNPFLAELEDKVPAGGCARRSQALSLLQVAERPYFSNTYILPAEDFNPHSYFCVFLASRTKKTASEQEYEVTEGFFGTL